MRDYYLNEMRQCLTCKKKYVPTSPAQKYCCPEHSPYYKEPNTYWSYKNKLYRSVNRWCIDNPKYPENEVVNSINNLFKNKEISIPLTILKSHPYFRILSNRKDGKTFKNYESYLSLCRYKANKLIKIPKGQLCEECSINIATVRHHPDYSKPLYIQFLCRSCHVKGHRTP